MWMWITTNGAPKSMRLMVSSTIGNIINTSWVLGTTSRTSIQKNMLTELIQVPRYWYSIQSWCKSHRLRWRNEQSQILPDSQQVQTTQGEQEVPLCLLCICFAMTTKPSSNIGWYMKMLASYSTRHPTSSCFLREFMMLVSVCLMAVWWMTSDAYYLVTLTLMLLAKYVHHDISVENIIFGKRWRWPVDWKGQQSGICMGENYYLFFLQM